jgi:hypothetical protein
MPPEKSKKNRGGDISKVKSRANLAPADAGFACEIIFRQEYGLRKSRATSPKENENSLC